MGSSCCCFLLLLLSVGTLTPLQYGLTVNLITKQVNSDIVYEGGRHLIGPWKSFLAFPSTRVTVSFDTMKNSQGPLQTRTKDGLALTLQLAFQYRIDRAYLGKLFALANQQYEPLFVRNARDVLLKAAADYEAIEYWQDREKIGKEMRELLNTRLSQVYATCGGLQIMVIDLPPEFETSIVQTQVTEQMQQTRHHEQQAKRISADTEVLKAQYNRNVTVTRNGADALYTQAVGIAQAEAQQRLLEVEASAMHKANQPSGQCGGSLSEAHPKFCASRSLTCT
ncbi:Vacuolar protein sorting-associated protein 18-like [Durusdinium trenchii]|uniref:Vacuolar protein sorting-associated protein 18-like n=1 Tax=Durusdinium trenchii TaxID=1381693 RepID=A0ABP0JG08_9DINO